MWETHDDLMGSDHFPIILSSSSTEDVTREPRYNTSKADWKRFTALSVIPPPDENLSCDELLRQFNTHIIQVADMTIPKTSGEAGKVGLPWWTSECTNATNQRKQALRRYKRTRTQVDLISFKRQTAIARRVKVLARRESWQAYVSTINRSTPMSKIWGRLRKMTGKFSSHQPPTLTVGTNTTSDPSEVAEYLADHYARVSNAQSYDREFLDVKNRAEQQQLDFTTVHNLSYNEPISKLEVVGAIRSSKRTAPGEDEITYDMLR